MTKSALIFLNSKPPKKSILNKFLALNNHIICADGGANRILKHNIIPDIILGDLDSINKKTLNYFYKKGIEIRKIEEQETTDFEKSLLYCLSKKINSCVIFGAISTRPDHTLNNFSILKRYYKKMNLKIIDDRFEIIFINKFISFDYQPGSVVSFLGFPVARGIITEGLKYTLNNEDLELGEREGTLNICISNKVSIKFKKGDLLLFKRHYL